MLLAIRGLFQYNETIHLRRRKIMPRFLIIALTLLLLAPLMAGAESGDAVKPASA